MNPESGGLPCRECLLLQARLRGLMSRWRDCASRATTGDEKVVWLNFAADLEDSIAAALATSRES